VSAEYDSEPVRGLPEALPAGETMLWQGSPTWKSLMLRLAHVRLVAAYFAALLLWSASTAFATPATEAFAAVASLRLVGLAAVLICLLALFAALVARTTVYTITNRRVVIRSGIAIPMILNIPYKTIASAGFKAHADGTGDLVLTLDKAHKIAWLALWPHVRPWRLAHAEPMLRSIPDGVAAAQILARALAANASQPVPALPDLAWKAAGSAVNASATATA